MLSVKRRTYLVISYSRRWVNPEPSMHQWAHHLQLHHQLRRVSSFLGLWCTLLTFWSPNGDFIFQGFKDFFFLSSAAQVRTATHRKTTHQFCCLQANSNAKAEPFRDTSIELRKNIHLKLLIQTNSVELGICNAFIMWMRPYNLKTNERTRWKTQEPCVDNLTPTFERKHDWPTWLHNRYAY